MKTFLKLFVIILWCISCSERPTVLTPDPYVRWISSKNNGLIKEKKINNISIKSRYLPGEYLAYREWLSDDSVSFDSVLNAYRCALTFQVQLSAEKNDKEFGNLMYYEVADREAFVERSHFLNFSIDDFIWLQSNGVKYEPVLSNFEGYDQLGNKLSFQIVFIVPEYSCGVMKPEFENLLLVFDDPYWNLGSVNFEFEKQSFSEIPKLEF